MNKKLRNICLLAIALALLVFGIRGLHIQSVSEYEKESEQLAGQLEIDETTAEPSGKSGAGSGEKAAPKDNTAVEKKSVPKKRNASKPGAGSGAKRTPKADGKPQKKKAPEADVGSEKKSVPGTDAAEQKKDTIQCTISIRCSALKDRRETLEDRLLPYVPENGVILSAVKVRVAVKSSVYDVLSAVCKAKKIALDAEYTPLYDSYYVRGINHLYEMDAGDRSGWLYTVNRKKPDVGASAYQLSDGDSIVWSYSCDGTI